MDAEVESLIDDVMATAGQYVASLRPRLRRVVTPLSVACRRCEYRGVEAGQPDGFRECWSKLADAEPHVLDLYQVGKIAGRGGPVADQLIRQAKVKLYDLPRGSLVKADGTVGVINKRQLIQIDHTRNNSE